MKHISKKRKGGERERYRVSDNRKKCMSSGNLNYCGFDMCFLYEQKYDEFKIYIYEKSPKIERIQSFKRDGNRKLVITNLSLYNSFCSKRPRPPLNYNISQRS